MGWRARSAQVVLFPMDEDEISVQSSRMAVTSINGVLSGPQRFLPGHRGDLAQMHVQILHLTAIDLLARDGTGREPKIDAAPTSSGPVDGPVQTRTRRGSCVRCAASIRAASAVGTALA
jgi:hypothetical protein